MIVTEKPLNIAPLLEQLIFGVLKIMMDIKIDVLLAKILEKETFNRFTVIKLRDEYLLLSPITFCPNEARRYLYKHILRLVKLGVLTKSGTKNSQKIVYKKTNLFNDANFIVIGDQLPLKNFDKPLPVSNKKKLDSISRKKLEKTLKEYKVDMMSAIGESEEYMRLFDYFPEIKEQLREKYYTARDKSSKLLGNIKAIQAVLVIQLEAK